MASSHNSQSGGIYIRGLGGGRRQYKMVIILSSASAVSFRVAAILREKAIYRYTYMILILSFCIGVV